MKKISLIVAGLLTAISLAHIPTVIGASTDVAFHICVVRADGQPYIVDGQQVLAGRVVNGTGVPSTILNLGLLSDTKVSGIGQVCFTSKTPLYPTKYTIWLEPVPLGTEGSNSNAHGEVAPIPTIYDLSAYGGQTYDATLALLPATKFVSGTVTDEGGNPVSGMYVTARFTNTDGEFLPNYVRFSAKTNANGAYRFGLSGNGGDFAISANGDGIKYYQNNGAPSGEEIVSFKEDASAEEYTVNTTVDKKTTNSRILGRVIHKNGTSFPGLIVKAILNSDPSQFGNPGRVKKTITDTRGAFYINLDPGVYTISIEDPLIEDPESYYAYANIWLNLSENFSHDFGKIKPYIEYHNWKSEFRSPVILSFNNNIILSPERKATQRNISFHDTFSSAKFINTKSSTGAIVTGGSIVFQNINTASLNNVQITTLPQIVYSKIFTPLNTKISSILLKDTNTVTNASLRYEISDDGTKWFAIPPHKLTAIPKKFDTKKGLRWRAIIYNQGTNASATIDSVNISYIITSPKSPPTLSTVNSSTKNNIVTLVLSGQNLQSGSRIFLGKTKVGVTKKVNAKTVVVAFKRSLVKTGSYEVTLLGPQLGLTIAPKRVTIR